MKRILGISLAIFIFKSSSLWANGPFVSEVISGMDFIFGIDGGGSHTTLQVRNKKMEILDLEHEGKIEQSIVVGPGNINTVSFPEVKVNLEKLLKGLKIGKEKQEIQDIKDKSAIVCALAGLKSNTDKEPSLRDIFTDFGFNKSKIALFPDFELTKQLIDEEGAILIAGTGSIGFSKSSKGEKRIGGYGYILGDEGSGFYVGKLALQKALQNEFENKPFSLTKSICELLGVNPISQTISRVYQDKLNPGKLNPADIAKIAPLVFEAAYKQNDDICKAIINKTAKKLAHHVIRAVEGSTYPNFPIYLTGGLFKSENADNFIEIIRKNVSYEPGLKLINIAKENIAMLVVLKNLEHGKIQ